jgi:hypothetical protein
VDTLARRIASFDKDSIAAVKQQINRYTLPSAEDLKSSADIYFDSFGWPGSRRRLPAALAAGRTGPATTRCASAITWATSETDNPNESCARRRLSVPHATMSL